MSKQTHKIIFAAGGTGGHLFPAQALAEQLLDKKPDVKLVFVGAKLSNNPYFDKVKFSFQDIDSATLFSKNIFKIFQSITLLFKGIRTSLSFISAQKPDLVIGFGSFHVFPVLCAAIIKKIPLVLFESNSIPGKVIRLFSKKALTTAIYFPEAARYLRGNTVEVNIPIRKPESRHIFSQEEARQKLQLATDLPTVLIFGGSQGANKINRYVFELVPLLKRENISFQLLHFTGCEETAKQIKILCQSLDIPCYAKKFESQMNIAWSAADLAICRSGAMTLSEILHYEVPAILIPYPVAADQHQLKNALFLEKVGAVVHFTENSITALRLIKVIRELNEGNPSNKMKMKQAIKDFNKKQKKIELDQLIIKVLDNANS